MTAIIIAGVFVYHLGIARRVGLRTPGELLMGCTIADRTKRWANPYPINRAPLFAICFVALVVAVNSWDSAADDQYYSSLTVPVVTGRMLLVALLLTGILMMGMRRAWGGLLIALYFAVSSVGNLMLGLRGEAVASPSVSRGLAGFQVVMTIVSLAVTYTCHRATERRPAPPAAAHDRERRDEPFGGRDG